MWKMSHINRESFICKSSYEEIKKEIFASLFGLVLLHMIPIFGLVKGDVILSLVCSVIPVYAFHEILVFSWLGRDSNIYA